MDATAVIRNDVRPTIPNSTRSAPWPPPSSTPASSATSSAATPCATCGRTRTAPRKYLAIERALAIVQGRLGIIPQEAADEIVRNCDIAQDRHGQAARADRAHRLPDPRRRVAVERAVPRQAWASTATGARPRRTSPTPRRCCRSAKASTSSTRISRRSRRRSRRSRAQVPRHADGRPQQPAAGDPVTFGYKMATILAAIERHRERLAQLRSRACWSANSAAPAGRSRRSNGRDGNAGRADEGARPRPAGRSPGTRCATTSPRSAAFSASSAARSARSRWTSS